MPPKPATKGNELIKLLNRLTTEGGVNQLSIAGLKRDAKQLLKNDAFTANTILGAVACLERDEVTMRERHEASLRIRQNTWALMNYSTSLTKLGLLDDGIEMAMRACQLNEPDPEVLTVLVRETFNSGRFVAAGELLVKLLKIVPNNKDVEVDVINESIRIQSKHQLDDESTHRFVKIVMDVLRGNKKYPIKFVWSHPTDVVRCKIHVDANIEELVELNSELADSLAEAGLVPDVSKGIVVRFVPE